MNCASQRERLNDWFDGELDEEERAHTEAHLLACSSCAQEAFEHRETRRQLVATLLVTPPADLRERIRHAARDRGLLQQTPNQSPASPGAWRPPLWAAAAVVLFAIWLGSQFPAKSKIDPDPANLQANIMEEHPTLLAGQTPENDSSQPVSSQAALSRFWNTPQPQASSLSPSTRGSLVFFRGKQSSTSSRSVAHFWSSQ